MTRGMLSACSVVLALVVAGPAEAGEVRLEIKDGRVALVARDATLREILLEWERVGGTRIVNRDRVPGTRLNLEFANVTEEQALATLLRPIAGYIGSRRLGPEGGASAFSRLVLMPGEATPFGAGPPSTPSALRSGSGNPPSGMEGQPLGRPGMQRRVLPDGRIVTVMDETQQAGDPDEADEAPAPTAPPPGIVRPPFVGSRMQQGQVYNDGPQRMQQGQPIDVPQDVPPGQAGEGTKAAPVVPATVPMPGALPSAKPPTSPPKPPGD